MSINEFINFKTKYNKVKAENIGSNFTTVQPEDLTLFKRRIFYSIQGISASCLLFFLYLNKTSIKQSFSSSFKLSITYMIFTYFNYTMLIKGNLLSGENGMIHSEIADYLLIHILKKLKLLQF